CVISSVFHLISLAAVRSIEDTTVGIYIIKDHAASEEPEDTGIILEGVKVLQDLGNVAFAVAMLFGLMYAMNLSYKTELRYTLSLSEGFYGTEWGKLNKNVAFKTRLFQ
uniref:Uncharacterized protein n=1 Tax=Hucho hucho TaxID=62062 RepID=A0A4W5JVM5_9TELE